jgi:hypothetical protein
MMVIFLKNADMAPLKKKNNEIKIVVNIFIGFEPRLRVNLPLFNLVSQPSLKVQSPINIKIHKIKRNTIPPEKKLPNYFNSFCIQICFRFTSFFKKRSLFLIFYF